MELPGVGRNPVQEQRARWERQRSRTARELVATEQEYLARLELVATYFVAVLKAKRTLKPAVREVIFGPLEPLCSASRALLFHLEKGHLRPGLESLSRQLSLYIDYAENLTRAKKALQEQLRRNRAFSRFKELQERRPELKDCRLEDLLPLPLQRLHQYRCLLQLLVENTSPSRADSVWLTGVLQSVSEAFHQVQEISHFHENADRMCQVQKRLKGRKTQVLAPGRWYLQEGWLKVVPPKGEELQPRMFFLFSDILLMTRPCHPLHPWNAHKLACQAVFPLSQCAVGKVFGHTRSQGGLLSLTFPHTKLLLLSCDEEELSKWHRNLLAAVRQLQVGPSLVH